MKKQTKKIIVWSIVAIIIFIIVIIVKNWDAFMCGFNAGGDMGE